MNLIKGVNSDAGFSEKVKQDKHKDNHAKIHNIPTSGGFQGTRGKALETHKCDPYVNKLK